MTPKNTHQKIELTATKRDEVGSGLNILRTSGYIPAVVYGKGMDAISIKVDKKDFGKALKEAGESTLVYLKVDSKEYPTIIHDLTSDPVSGQLLHADFYKVRLDEEITAHVPLVFEGESPAVKDLSGILIKNLNEIEVKALPQNLPHEIKVDISVLKEMGATISVKDLKMAKDVHINAEADAIIALVQEPISEEELKASLEEPTTTVEDVEVIKKEKTEEEIAEEEAPKSEEKKEE